MARNIGPVERLSRREGVDLELKGLRRLSGKGALARRGAIPPGQHGQRRRKQSIYGQQLREAQKAKRYYGVREKQFRRYFETAASAGGEERTGDRLMSILESRLDNVLVRLGLATTRAQARQFIVHGHVRVNDGRVDIPSYLVRRDDVISIDPSDCPIVVPQSKGHAGGHGAQPPHFPAKGAGRGASRDP